MDDDDKPINCIKCGRFMKVTSWTGEDSQECEEYSCVCGSKEIYN